MSERNAIIVALISGQDVRKWNIPALVEWATAVADKLLQDGPQNG